MRFIIIIVAGFLFIQCNKELTTGDATAIPDNLTVLALGNFTNGAHTTTGTVKLTKDGSGKKYLVFENFKTESGPDIRLWIAEDKDAKGYIELSKNVQLGSYKVDLASDIDTGKQKYILIWCKAFSVLFGSAELK
ncbi:MAG: DM13 domain-containing protein [Saprospiraceae bacterium]